MEEELCSRCQKSIFHTSDEVEIRYCEKCANELVFALIEENAALHKAIHDLDGLVLLRHIAAGGIIGRSNKPSEIAASWLKKLNEVDKAISVLH